MKTIESVEFWSGTACMVVRAKSEEFGLMVSVFSDMEGGENKPLCVEYYYEIGY